MRHLHLFRHTGAAAILAALPAAGFAQPQAEGRLDAVTGRHDGDRPIPEVFWEEEVHGLYGVDGDCDDPDAVWAFAVQTVGMGRTICTALGKLTFHDDWLHIPASQCSRMGESVDDLWIALREAGDGAFSARIGEDGETLRLERCPPAEE